MFKSLFFLYYTTQIYKINLKNNLIDMPHMKIVTAGVFQLPWNAINQVNASLFFQVGQGASHTAWTRPCSAGSPLWKVAREQEVHRRYLWSSLLDISIYNRRFQRAAWRTISSERIFMAPCKSRTGELRGFCERRRGFPMHTAREYLRTLGDTKTKKKIKYQYLRHLK